MPSLRYLGIVICHLIVTGALGSFVSSVSAGDSTLYDGTGRLREVVTFSGSKLAYTYDAAGNITAMTVTPGTNAIPVLTSEPALAGEAGVLFSQTLTSSKPATTFSATGLPSGLMLDNATGEISGTPATAGVSQANLTLSAGGQMGNASISIQIRPASVLPWPRFAGKYSGTVIANSPSASAGAGTVTLSATGSFTASLMFQGVKVSVSGAMSPTGTFTRTIARPGQSSLQVTLAVSRIDESITGTISDGTTVAIVDTNRPRVATDPAIWQTGAWTFLLRPVAGAPGNAPKGSGYGRISVAKTGVAGFMVAALPDGTAISGSVTLGKQNDATFFQGLYAGKGFLTGRLSFDDAPLVGGDFSWGHPALPADPNFKTAFNASLLLEGSRFTARPAGTRIVDFPNTLNNARLSVGQGSLTAPFSKVFTLTIANKGDLTPPNDEKVVFSIAATGLFSGSFLDATSGKILTFKGMILQEQLSGAGFFLGPPASGLVELTPAL